ETKRWPRWFGVSLVTLLGFLLVEGSLVALLYLFLPSQLASEVVWPSWMVQNYEAYCYITVSLMHWFNVNYFVGAQLPLVAAVLAGLAFAGRLLFTRRAVTTDGQSAFLHSGGPSLFFAIFFALALLIYLPHMWVATSYVWMILLPAVFFLRKIPRLWFGVFLLFCFPAFLLSVRGLVRPTVDWLR